MDRTERFYKIQSLLMGKPSVTMKQMQGALEVSRATLNRDLAYMRDRLHIPFAWDILANEEQEENHDTDRKQRTSEVMNILANIEE